MPSAKIKTLIIEDSGFMRIYLSDLLRSDHSIEIIGTASNGLEGVEKVKALKPDVVITDMVMPLYDGLFVVKTLMREMPLPIILLSSLNRTDPQIFDALQEGAFDFIDKPHDKLLLTGYPSLTAMVREASLTDYLKLRLRKKGVNNFVHTFEAKLNYDILVIGSSTGGPGAVEYIINNLPANLSIPVIVAQHMPERFIESFSCRLKNSTGLAVSVATDGEPLLPQHIYLAPGNCNIMVVRTENNRICIKKNDKSYKEFNNPSIDSLFESVAEVYKKRAIGVILTGMGRDGVTGLTRISEGGGFTISQDEESSVVYGMPKAAFESGASKHQISLKDIPNFIINSL